MNLVLAAGSVVVSAVLAAGGCATGSSSNNKFSGEKKNVAQTVDDLSTAAGKSDEKTICTSLLSRALVQRLNSGSSTCQKTIGAQIDSADDTSITVNAVTINGAQATADVTSKFNGHDRKQTVRLVRESGGWRIDGLG